MLSSMPGVGGAALRLGRALEGLRAAATVGAGAMTAEAACFGAQITAIGVAQGAISAVALASVEASASGSIEATASLTASLPDPLAYIEQLIAGLEAVLATLLAGPPLPALTATLSASAAASLALSAEVAEIVAQISVLASISLAAGLCVSELLAAQVALAKAVLATDGAATAYGDVQGQLGTSGAFSVVYNGTLAGLGAAVNLVTPSTGIGGAELVRATVQLVRQSDAPALAAQASLLRTS